MKTRKKIYLLVFLCVIFLGRQVSFGRADHLPSYHIQSISMISNNQLEIYMYNSNASGSTNSTATWRIVGVTNSQNISSNIDAISSPVELTFSTALCAGATYTLEITGTHLDCTTTISYIGADGPVYTTECEEPFVSTIQSDFTVPSAFGYDPHPHYSLQYMNMVDNNTIEFSVTNSNTAHGSTNNIAWQIDGISSGTIISTPTRMDDGTAIQIMLPQALRYNQYTLHVTGYHSDVINTSGSVSNTFTAAYGYDINSIKAQTVLYPLATIGDLETVVGPAVDNLDSKKKNEAIVYSNGLGKSIQSVAIKSSPSQNDVVSHIEYDQYGLQTKSYSPYTETTNGGAYRSNAQASQSAFYTSPPAGVASTTYPYAQKVVEQSPLLRVLKQGAVGADWQPGQHTVATEYGTNITNDILMFDAGTEQGALSIDPVRWYSAGELYKTRIKDEDGKTSVVYKDKSDKEILKESFIENNSKRVQTYYVYDQYGNLRFIIPPEAIKELDPYNGGTWTIFLKQKWVTEYCYDSYNRQIEKYAPEEEVVTTVYDYLGRVVLRQDGMFRADKKWLFTKYDKYSRVVMTGVFYDDDGSWQREDWQSYFDGLGVQYEVRNQSSLGYTNNTFPYNDESNSWTITYYDDYDFDNDGVADVQKINEAEFDTTDHDDTFYPNYKVSGFAQFNRLQDKVTKTKVKVFTATEGIYDQSNKQYNNCPYFPANLYYKGDKITLSPGFQTHTSQNVHIGANITLPSTSTKWLETVMFYDKYGRVIQTQSSNHLDGMDIVSTQYEFAGKVLQTKRTHYVAFQ